MFPNCLVQQEEFTRNLCGGLGIGKWATQTYKKLCFFLSKYNKANVWIRMKLMKLGFSLFSCKYHVSVYSKWFLQVKCQIVSHNNLAEWSKHASVWSSGPTNKKNDEHDVLTFKWVVCESMWLTLFLLQWPQMGGRGILHAHLLLLDSRTGVNSTRHQREVKSILWRWWVHTKNSLFCVRDLGWDQVQEYLQRHEDLALPWEHTPILWSERRREAGISQVLDEWQSIYRLWWHWSWKDLTQPPHWVLEQNLTYERGHNFCMMLAMLCWNQMATEWSGQTQCVLLENVHGCFPPPCSIRWSIPPSLNCDNACQRWIALDPIDSHLTNGRVFHHIVGNHHNLWGHPGHWDVDQRS